MSRPLSLIRQQSKNPDYRFKVVMIGDANVGKTCMISSYMENNFQSQKLCTIGLDIKSKYIEVQNKIVLLELWDTPGNMDNFRSIPKSQYKGADAVVIVYDITDSISFQNINKYWLDEVINNADSDVKVMVFGTKIDLESQRKVSLFQGQNYCQKKTLNFREVTATEPQLIHEAFVSLFKLILPNKKSIEENREILRIRLNNDQNQTCWKKFMSFFR